MFTLVFFFFLGRVFFAVFCGFEEKVAWLAIGDDLEIAGSVTFAGGETNNAGETDTFPLLVSVVVTSTRGAHAPLASSLMTKQFLRGDFDVNPPYAPALLDIIGAGSDALLIPRVDDVPAGGSSDESELERKLRLG